MHCFMFGFGVSCPLYTCNTLDIFMVHYSFVDQGNMSQARMTTLTFIVVMLLPLDVSEQ